MSNNKIEIQVDGTGASPHSAATWGLVVLDESGKQVKLAEEGYTPTDFVINFEKNFLNEKTHFASELYAIYKALMYVKEHGDKTKKYVVYCDNQRVLNTVLGMNFTRFLRQTFFLRQFTDKVRALFREMKPYVRLQFTFKGEDNKMADYLSRYRKEDYTPQLQEYRMKGNVNAAD